MGKKLDAILGRNFKSSKLKGLLSLAISRVAVLRNQRQVRCNQAHSDVAQLLQQGHRERALIRVEQVIKEQNMLDVLVMLEGHCNLLIERVHLIEQDRVCSDELKEAISCLLYASTRCGDFPELQEIRAVFTSWYGKEFASRAIELRNNCGVSPKMIQKLSTRQPDSEMRRKVLKEIAAENNIALQLDEEIHNPQSTFSNNPELVENHESSSKEKEKDGLSDSVKARKKYADVADAAQAAFESAAYAAEAARAAVELSRSDPRDPDDQNSPKSQGKIFSGRAKSESRDQVTDTKNEAKEQNPKVVAELKRSASIPSSDSMQMGTLSFGEKEGSKHIEKDVVFDERDNETHFSDFRGERNNPEGDSSAFEKSNEQIPLVIQTGPKKDQGHKHSISHAAEGPKTPSSHHLNLGKLPISVRTSRLRGY